MRTPSLQTELFPSRPSAPLRFRRFRPQRDAGEGGARNSIPDFRCCRAEELAYAATSPRFSPWAGSVIVLAPRSRASQRRRARTDGRTQTKDVKNEGASGDMYENKRRQQICRITLRPNSQMNADFPANPDRFLLPLWRMDFSDGQVADRPSGQFGTSK